MPIEEPRESAASSEEQESRSSDGNGGSNGRRRRLSIAILAAVLVVGGGAGLWYYLANRGVESTDDAFIAGNVYRIAPRVEGRVAAVPVKDNQLVKAKDLIATVDPSDFEARVQQARAARDLAGALMRQAEVEVGITEASTAAGLSQAQALLKSAEARLQQEQAALESAEADRRLAEADLERYTRLSEHAVSPQRVDAVRSRAADTAAQVRAAQKRVTSAEADIAAAESGVAAAEADRQRVAAARAEVERRQAEVQQAEAALHEAELQLSYCQITAPADGRITNKSILPGDYAKVGQNLLALVAPDVWVVANFKETQLEEMKPGQPVTIHVDAYDADFDGHVESIQSGSGAHFSLLPPQNATGNYVKVVQRVPVKIVFDKLPDPERYRLGPGMSVVPKVRVR